MKGNRSPILCGLTIACGLIAVAERADADDLKLVATRVVDERLGVTAVHLLVPAGWSVEGGVTWRVESPRLAEVGLRVRDPAARRELVVLPNREFAWRIADDPTSPRPLLGSAVEQKPPFGDAVVFAEREVVPQLHAQATRVEIVAREPLPQLARVFATARSSASDHRDVSAARVRVRVAEAEEVWEEDVYCVIAQARAPAGGEELIRWGTERLYLLRARNGELDANSAILESVASSYRIDSVWAARYRALMAALNARPGRGHLGRSDLEALQRDARALAPDGRDAAAEEAEALRVRVNAVLAMHYGRTQNFFDPRNEREVLLPRGFARAWANAAGDYLLSASAEGNPATMDAEAAWAELHAVSAR